MKERKWLLPLLALALIAAVSVAPAMAYFTTFTRASGGYTLYRETTTEIHEEYSDWKKDITIKNTEGKPVYVRARAYAGSTFELTYSGTGWTQKDDGWWYYGTPLTEGQTAGALRVAIGNVPKAQEGGAFNVAVVYESTPVQYKEDGTPFADWSMILEGETVG